MSDRRWWRELAEMAGWGAAATILPPVDARGTHQPSGDVFDQAQRWQSASWLTREEKRRLSWWSGVIIALVALVFALVVAMVDYAKPWSVALMAPGYVYLAAAVAFALGLYLTLVVSDRYDKR